MSLQKYRTILEEVKDACRQVGVPEPDSVFASQDQTALLMGSVGNLAGIMLCDTFNWQELQKEFIVVGDGVQKEFDLPEDFSSIVDNTGWSYTIRRPVIVLDARQWAAISTWLSQSFYINPACRIYQSKLQFMSAPPTGNITFQYRVLHWVIDGDDPAVFKAFMTKDTDKPRFDWLMMVLGLKVKWLEQKAMDTTAAQADLNTRYFQLTERDKVAPVLPLSGPNPGGFRYLDNFFNTPDSNVFGN